MTKIIYESDSLLAKLEIGETLYQTLVITFVGRNKDQDKARFFGDAFLNKYGYSCLAVACKSNEWYQYEDFDQMCKYIQAESKNFQKVIVYGASMGAYAALEYSRYYSSDVCIALSPQFTVDPSWATFDTRWTNDIVAIDSYRPPILELRKNVNYYIFYDHSHIVDRQHVNKIASERDLNNVTKISIPFSGHVVGDFDKHLLSESILNIIKGDFDLRAFNENRKQLVANSKLYHTNLIKVLSKRKSNLLFSAYLKEYAFKVGALEPDMAVKASKLLVREKEFYKALHICHQCLYKHPVSRVFRQLSYVYFNLKLYVEAKAIIDKAIEYDPSSENYRMLDKILNGQMK